MKLTEDNKIAQVFARHYGTEDALEIERCIKVIMLDKAQAPPYRERLINVLMKNAWSAEDAQSFVGALTEGEE